MTHVILSTVNNGIQKVILNKPANKNALSSSMYKELAMLLDESAQNESVSMFVLTANGDFFSSGNDLIDAAVNSSTLNNINLPYKVFVDALIVYPKLLVAMVNGPAIGIACTILGLFDMVYASDQAYFYTPFTLLGLVAEGCSTYTFPKLLGHSKAGDMLYMGYKMSAQEAKQRGLISETYNHDTLEETWNYLNKISTLSSESILAIKRLISKWNKDILLKINAEESKELLKRLESTDLMERVQQFLSRKHKL